jgi:4-amino-4-deoxy-L-arabinose transferase-like glycosyltransferase
MTTRSSRWTGWLLIALVWAAFGLRVYRLEAQSLWSDEGLSLYRSRLPLTENLSNVIVVPPGVPTQDTNPPLYFVALSVLRVVAGESEYALRFASVLAGVALVALLYATGRRLFSERAGVLAALLGTFSPFLIWYSQEARMYTLLVALSLASVYLLLRAIGFPAQRVKPRRSWLAWIAWAVVTGAMLYAHFTTFFVLLFESLLILIALLRARRREALVLLGVLALAALPLLAYGLSRAQSGVDPVFGFRPLDSLLAEVWGTFMAGRTNDLFQPWWAVLPGLLLLFVGLIGGLIDRAQRRAMVVTALYLVVPLLAFYSVTLVRPLYTGPRHVMFLLPPAYLLVAFGLAQVWQRWRVVGAAALAVELIIMCGWLRVQFTDPAYLKDDMRSAACTIAAQAGPDDVVVVHDAITSFVFDYYYQRCGGVAPWQIIPAYPSFDVDQALREFQAAAESATRLWFVTHPPPLNGFAPKALDEWARGHLLRLGHAAFPSIWLGSAYQLYTAHFPILRALPSSANPIDLRWPTIPLRLTGVDRVSVTPEHDRAQITYYWQVERAPDYNLEFTTRLVDGSGAEWGLLIGSAFDNWSAKKWPVGQIVKHTVDLSLPRGLPPGEYAVRVKAAYRQTGEVQAAANGQDEVEVARMTIK